MTNETENDEQLSAFVDSELTQEHCEQVINRLCKGQDIKSCFERYQMISDTMRGQLPVAMKRDFVACVMKAIESEPALLAPSASPSKQSGFSTHFTRKVAGFAIAASVATLAVIGVQSQYQETPQQVATMPDNSEFVRLAKEKPVGEDVQPVMVPGPRDGFATASSPFAQNRVVQASPVKKLNPQLHQYIVIHSQQASGAGMHDIISSARIISSSQPQNSDQVQR